MHTLGKVTCHKKLARIYKRLIHHRILKNVFRIHTLSRIADTGSVIRLSSTPISSEGYITP